MTSAANNPAGSPRRIIHLDMDAFYASVEQRDDPSLRGRPVAVGGSPQVARRGGGRELRGAGFGVRSAMPMARALRQCPELCIVRPDFARYRAVSQQVMAILRSATALVEPLSLDEAYLDVTENRFGEALATNVAKQLKARIRDELALTASAGVAPNKFLAKIASGWQKPDGLTVIAPERVEAFLQKLPVEALWGVGPVTAKKLRAIGVARLVDVRTADPALLGETVGSLAEWLLRLSHGDDRRPVTPDRPWKSISAETTYAEDLREVAVMRAELARLAGRVTASLQKRELVARSVTIKVRYGDFTTVTRSHTAEAPTADAAAIVALSVALLDRTQAASRPVRLLGVGAHGLMERGDAPPAGGALSFEFPAQLVDDLHQLGALAGFGYDREDHPDPGLVILVFERVGFQRRGFLGHEAITRAAGGGNRRGAVERYDLRGILRVAEIELLPVDVADLRGGFHQDARLRAIDSGLEGTVGIHGDAVHILRGGFAAVPDVAVEVLREPVECVLGDDAIHGDGVAHHRAGNTADQLDVTGRSDADVFRRGAVDQRLAGNDRQERIRRHAAADIRRVHEVRGLERGIIGRLADLAAEILARRALRLALAPAFLQRIPRVLCALLSLPGVRDVRALADGDPEVVELVVSACGRRRGGGVAASPSAVTASHSGLGDERR